MTKETIVIFDGVCNFCNSSVNFIIKRDKHRKFLFAPSQSETGTKLLKEYKLIQKTESPDSVILIKKGKVYQKSSAALEILHSLGGIYSAFIVLKILPAFSRDSIYNCLARNRYKWFGRRDSCIVPAPEIRSRFLG